MRSPGRLLGFDLGSRRIGVAVSDGAQMVATGVTAVERTGDRGRDHAALRALVAEYEAIGAVVGVPYSLSGQVGPAATAILAEVEALARSLGVEVETVDERFTTVVASRSLRAAGRRAKAQRAVIDQEAAALLLQDWIDRRGRGG